jgi:hypothetical protein
VSNKAAYSDGRPSVLQLLGVRPWSLHLTWVWGQQQGKRYRLQEAGLWRGEAPGSTHYGGPPATRGAAAERFLAMDIIHPQVGTASVGFGVLVC